MYNFETKNPVRHFHMPSDITTDTYLYDEINRHYTRYCVIYDTKSSRRRVMESEGALLISARNHFKSDRDFGTWRKLVFPHINNRQTIHTRMKLSSQYLGRKTHV